MKIEMGREKWVVVAGAAAVLSFFLIFFIFFGPLSKKIKAKHAEYEAVRLKLSEAQYRVFTMDRKEKPKAMVTVEGLSLAVDELTKQGKSCGINFISITPQAVEAAVEGTKIFPIEMEIESSYQSIGIFLGALDDLEKSLVTVRRFELMSNETEPLKLKMKLTVAMHLAG